MQQRKNLVRRGSQDDLRTAASPVETLLAFLQSTYEAAADYGNWGRASLERELLPT